MYVRKIKPFRAEFEVDADKSITHRALILGSTAVGKTRIISPSLSLDCRSTLTSLKRLGVEVNLGDNEIAIEGGIKRGDYVLDAQNSGTTARLLGGLLSGITGVNALIEGDRSLSKRPMKRIVNPLRQMGARIQCCGDCLPLEISGTKLSGIEYSLPMPSAQLKSALLLAGLDARCQTILSGELDSRNHTELMLLAMCADLKIERDSVSYVDTKITLVPSSLRGQEFVVCGDFSSAIYFLVLALLTKDSSVAIKNVNLNPTRTAALELLKEIGGQISVINEGTDIEKRGTIVASTSRLEPFTIKSNRARKMIDELPLLAVAACFVEGKSVIEGVEELRYKESDRLQAITDGLIKMGAKIDLLDDSITILGKGRLDGGCRISSCGDHRIEMSLTIGAMLSESGAEIDSGYADISFPSFYMLVDKLAKGLQ